MSFKYVIINLWQIFQAFCPLSYQLHITGDLQGHQLSKVVSAVCLYANSYGVALSSPVFMYLISRCCKPERWEAAVNESDMQSL